MKKFDEVYKELTEGKIDKKHLDDFSAAAYDSILVGKAAHAFEDILEGLEINPDKYEELMDKMANEMVDTAEKFIKKLK